MTRVLLTGFEPFDDSTVNPSWQAVRLAATAPPDGGTANRGRCWSRPPCPTTGIRRSGT